MEWHPAVIVGVSASVNVPLHHKVQKFSSGTGSPGWPRKKCCKRVVCVIFTMYAKLTPDTGPGIVRVAVYDSD